MTSSSPVADAASNPATDPAADPAAVRAALREILRDDLRVDITRATPDARLVDDLGMDSVAFAIGMVAIEDRLGAVLDEQDLLTCDTVGELEAAILAKVPAAR